MAPDELGFSVRELMDLYTFKNEPLDPRRVEELRGELAGRTDGAATARGVGFREGACRRGSDFR